MTTDITAARHGGNPESVEAHASIEHDKTRLRSRIVEFVRLRGEHGATCDEVERALGLSHQTTSPRVTEANACGELIRTIARRRTRSGRMAAVYVSVTE